MNQTSQTNHTMKTSVLLKRFLPYYGPYKKIMVFDLFCAALTIICEMVLPLILRYITNQGLQKLAASVWMERISLG